MSAPDMTPEQESRWERSLPIISRFYEVDAWLEVNGWTPGRRRYALREASAAVSGIFPVILANDLVEADRRLAVIERVCAAIVETLIEPAPTGETLQ